MQAVGRFGGIIAQGVYTFSGPFHPFGGAVDIIVVQQEDGTFKSSPWYVKFGKFQGVLKRREKKVFVAVNDVDANFHMYLDHKGEAYFLKETDNEDAGGVLFNEAPSSGDEASIARLAIEFPKGEVGQDAKVDHDKEESEDERGDDLELRFEGRDASKQLIKDSVDERAAAAARALVETSGAEGTSKISFGVPESMEEKEIGMTEGLASLLLNNGSSAEVSKINPEMETKTGQFIQTLLNEVVALEVAQSSEAASDIVATAATGTIEAYSLPDNTVPTDLPKAKPKTLSNNEGVIKTLLHQAVGSPRSQTYGAASALVASAALASLARVAADSHPLPSFKYNSAGPVLLELPDDYIDGENEDKGGILFSGDTDSLDKENGKLPGTTAAVYHSSATTGVNSGGESSGGIPERCGSSYENQIDGDGAGEPRVCTSLPLGCNPNAAEVGDEVESRGVEVPDAGLLLDVREVDDRVGTSKESEVQNDTSVDMLRSVEADSLYEEVETPAKRLEKVGVTQDLKIKDEVHEVTQDIVVICRDPLGVSDLVVKPEQTGAMKMGAQNKVLEERLNEMSGQNTRSDQKMSSSSDEKDVAARSKELTSMSREGFTDIGSPRLKATIEEEMAWRDVINRAAMDLKVARPGKDYCRSRSLKGLQTKTDGSEALPEQSEKKSWGWFGWGGTSAPQLKQAVEQGSLKDSKVTAGEAGKESQVVEVGRDEVKDQPGLKAVEDMRKSTKYDNYGVSKNVESNDETSGQGGQAVGDMEEGTHLNHEDLILKAKLEDIGDLNDSKGHPRPGESGTKRRSIFNLLSRSNTSQSSVSTTSSFRSNDDLDSMVSMLKSQTSLERAECVVDLLDRNWKGTKEPVAVGRDSECRYSKQLVNQELEVGVFAVQNTWGGNRQGSFEDIDDAIVLGTHQEDLGKIGPIDNNGSNTSTNENIAKLSVDQAGDKLHNCRLEGDQEVNSIHVEVEDTSGSQHDFGVTTNEVKGANLLTVESSDEDFVEFVSNTEVMLISIDGHLITAPIVPAVDELLQAPPELHNSTGRKGVKDGGEVPGSNQLRVVGFEEMPDGNTALVNDEAEIMESGEESIHRQSSQANCDDVGPQPDSSVQNYTMRNLLVNPNVEGLTDLAKNVDVNNVGASQSKAVNRSAQNQTNLPSKSACGEVQTTLECALPIGECSDDLHSKDVTGSQNFEEMRAMVFEKLDEPSDGDSPKPSLGGIERFYSSRDLSEVENESEKRKMNRNMSVYMDAISGDEDELQNEEMADSASDVDVDKANDRSIPIPGAFDRARKAQSLDDMQALRMASESHPNARCSDVDGIGSSSKLSISRSVGSEPLILVQGLDELGACSSVLMKPQQFSSPSKISRARDKNSIEFRIAYASSKDEVHQAKDCTDELSMESRTPPSTGHTLEGREKVVSETGFELSLCRHLLSEKMGLEAAAKCFASAKVSLEDFKKSGAAIAANDKLVVQVGGRFYPWVVAAPIVLGILAFGQVLMSPDEGAIPVEKPVVVAGGKSASGTLATTSSGGWKLWPFGSRRLKTPETGLVSKEALLLDTDAAKLSSLTKQYLRINGYYRRQRKVRTNSPSSQQLASLQLKEGSNKITFTFVTRMLGKQQVDARIYLWKWNTRIVISDVDGTITKSDVLGQFMPLVGKDWTQSGVARLFSAIKKNGYELMFLSARAISQAYLTRQFLENIKQDGEVLPDGPVVISPDGLFPSLYREVIRRAPHEFKIACLEDIKSLFPPESKPFYAGFGNRDTDEFSYVKVGIKKGKIFIINPKGEVVVNNQVDVKSYSSLHKRVDDMFPSVTFTEQEDYNEWNYWKLPLQEIEDDQNEKSVGGSSSSRRSSKSERQKLP